MKSLLLLKEERDAAYQLSQQKSKTMEQTARDGARKLMEAQAERQSFIKIEAFLNAL